MDSTSHLATTCVLLTGGCGYIGSHICYELLKQPNQYDVIIVDNLSNSTTDNLNQLKTNFQKPPIFYQGDIRDSKILNLIFANHPVDVVIHLAGLKSVKESLQKPKEYHDNNVKGTQILLKCMKSSKVTRLIFSSSACVYGNPTKDQIPLTEESPTQPINPYGQSKLDVENILQNTPGRFISLRYFNPIGAHPSGLIGENPTQTEPENLLPYLLKVATHQLPKLNVFGNDYQTPDGTAIRDYIHVQDLAKAHVKALNYITDRKTIDLKYEVYNIGTGKGYSVLEIIQEFNKQNVPINYEFSPRRAGDAEQVYSNPSKANQTLNWKAQLDLPEMVRDSWNWHVRRTSAAEKESLLNI